MYPPILPAARPRRRRVSALRLVRDGTVPVSYDYPLDTTPITSAADVFRRMAPFADREVSEVFWLLPLTVRRRLVTRGPVVISRGILDGSLVHAREVFAPAILAFAGAVILVHNHPSGDPTPSPDDRAITGQLVAVGQLLGIPVHDHVIIGRGRYASFVDAGLL